MADTLCIAKIGSGGREASERKAKQTDKWYNVYGPGRAGLQILLSVQQIK